MTATASGFMIRFMSPDDVLVLRTVARWSGSEIDDDADVGRDRAELAGEDRVQIHLGDLGEIGDQLRHVLDDGGERLAVRPDPRRARP